MNIILNPSLFSIKESYIIDETIAIDATHFESRDQAPTKKKKILHLRKPKAKLAQWLKEQVEKEANLPIYEKKIGDQLDVPLTKLRTEIPQDPKWGVKRNSEGKNEF